MSKIYLGLDVHVASTVWYLVDDTGQVMGDGKVPTTEPRLEGVITRCQEQGGDGGGSVGRPNSCPTSPASPPPT